MMQDTINMLEKAKNESELERQRFASMLDAERGTHKETVAKFNLDKKNILMSTEEANLEQIRGGCRKMGSVSLLQEVINCFFGLYANY